MINDAHVERSMTDELLIRGKSIPVILKEVPQHELCFYLENPRLYSLVWSDGNAPTEEEIEEKLLAMDHVKQLIHAIKANGGLIDPVVVRGGDMVVLEGNSRLAAYRYLASRDAVRWGRIKAKILPADISESEVFALLGEYHIHGKTNWLPFEQAGYLYRRHKNQGVSILELVKEINLPKSQITHLISVRDFMLKHNQHEPTRWSYFDEYLKSRKIAAAREEYPEMDELVVEKIESNEIPTAMALRDGLKNICQAGGKILGKFVDGKLDFEQARDAADQKGVTDANLQKLSRFRNWLYEQDTADDIIEHTVRHSQFRYELEQIQKQCARLLKKLNDTGSA
ncbi:ParB-like nuclease family protein [Paraburkholderia silvatlantica]|uniref:ParB-like nuclease family protein n=1 Tax=Paraburkholderia silvatlantica TaxID=321895 RepID=A0A2V4U789_9BURK|nr:ParB N-terminal domain-containing protein [Paraburkholderia silvatlantica]PYE26363.1 ParB-like nuclease family protein [Paraburkholderia silvatlantica]